MLSACKMFHSVVFDKVPQIICATLLWIEMEEGERRRLEESETIDDPCERPLRPF